MSIGKSEMLNSLSLELSKLQASDIVTLIYRGGNDFYYPYVEILYNKEDSIGMIKKKLMYHEFSKWVEYHNKLDAVQFEKHKQELKEVLKNYEDLILTVDYNNGDENNPPSVMIYHKTFTNKIGTIKYIYLNDNWVIN